jgi:hypothetical protein
MSDDAEATEGESDWSDYESGPFCRHYSDPWDCDTPCGTCGHRCCKHSDECEEEGCGCEEWTEIEAVEEK